MDAPANTTATLFFWVNLEEKLGPLYYRAARALKQQGVTLLPVRMDQVARLASLTDSPHLVVLCSTRRQAEYLAFAKHVVPVLGLLLRQERLSFFHLSSFHKLDMGARLKQRRNYYFFKYPLNVLSLCGKLKKFHQLKSTQAQKWPGGRRAKVPGLSA